MDDLSLTVESLYINCTDSQGKDFNELNLPQHITKIKLPYYAKMPDLKNAVIAKFSELNYALKIQSNADSNFKISASLNGTGICVQFGNIANFAMDTLKLNDCYEHNVIERAVILLPTSSTEKLFNTGNCATFERVTAKKEFFSRQFKLPCCIFGIQVTGNKYDI